MLDLGIWQTGRERAYQRALLQESVDILGSVCLYLLSGPPCAVAPGNVPETHPVASFSLRYDANGFYDWDMDRNTIYCLRDMDHPSDFTFQASEQGLEYHLGVRVTMTDTAFC